MRGHENICDPKQLNDRSDVECFKRQNNKGNQNNTSETDAKTSQFTRESTGHEKKHHGLESLKTQETCAQTILLELWNSAQCLYTAWAHNAHGTTTTDDAHQTACSTPHAGEPLRGFSIHSCGAASCVMTWLNETTTRNLIM